MNKQQQKFEKVLEKAKYSRPLHEYTAKSKEEILADKWIAELTEAGYTYDDMISLFQEARRQYEAYKKRMEAQGIEVKTNSRSSLSPNQKP